jgi:class 3 adenylate cyclase
LIAEGEDIFGDGVNIAARLEALAEPGGVFVSNTVHDHVRDQVLVAYVVYVIGKAVSPARLPTAPANHQ